MQLEGKNIACFRQGKFLFDDVSFCLKPKQALMVTGVNGAGKSSLLRIISGMASAAKGNIYWDGKPVSETIENYVEHMHYLGHSNGIRLGLTIAENLLLASKISEQPINMGPVLDILQLSTYKHTQTQYLSAGQKRRVALARILLIPRCLWIMDEPLTALDIHTQKTLLQHIDTHLQNGGMCVLTSHQPITLQSAMHELRLAHV